MAFYDSVGTEHPLQPMGGVVRWVSKSFRHSTIYSPQVRVFNRYSDNGDRGELEDAILDEAYDERHCMFAFPVSGLHAAQV